MKMQALITPLRTDEVMSTRRLFTGYLRRRRGEKKMTCTCATGPRRAARLGPAPSGSLNDRTGGADGDAVFEVSSACRQIGLNRYGLAGRRRCVVIIAAAAGCSHQRPIQPTYNHRRSRLIADESSPLWDTGSRR